MKIKNIFVNFKNKLSTLWSKNKKLSLLSLALIGVVLIGFVIFPTSSKTEVKTEEKTSQSSSSGIISQMENKIKNMLLAVPEVSTAEVMLMCESMEIYEYLKNIDESKNADGSTTIHEEVAYEKNGSTSSPILLTSKMPKVIGVWIIINAVSPSTKLAITNSIKSVLNIDESRISILQER